MALYKILIDGFQSESFNLKELVDIGDTLYINKVDTMLDQGNVSYSTTTPVELGQVVRVGPQSANTLQGLNSMVSNEIHFESGQQDLLGQYESGGYITCSKNKSVNKSGIKGYYAEVTFKNNANSPVELFSIGSQVIGSSK